MKIRLFCALPVPTSVQSKLVAATQVLKAALSPASVSWVQQSNFHITLSFLGDVESNRVAELAAELRAACEGVHRFELMCQGIGCFPNLNRPRVIWAGLQGAEHELSQLQSRVAAVCAAIGAREEKGHFKGHVTLGRIRPKSTLPYNRLSGEVERSRDTVFGQWEVEAVELVCSDLSQGAPRYSVLHRAPLLKEKTLPLPAEI